MTIQIFWGSLLLGVCSVVHLFLVIGWARYLSGASEKINGLPTHLNLTVLMGGTFGVIVLSHTLQVWIWALSFVWLRALPDLTDAIYFSLVTYTTLGYGDITLKSDFKIFGSMAAVTGLLNFGVSTAVLVAILGRALQTHLNLKP